AALRLAAAWEPAVLEIDARLERSRGSVRWISRIHNPLNEPAGVLITTNPPPADAVESVHRRLQPGESAEFGVDLPLLRRPGVQFAEVFLCIAGFRHPIGQRVAIECVNPVQAELCPLSRNDVQLVVRVPPGEGFSGTLRLEGEFLDPQQNPQLPIALDVGGEPLRKLIRLTESRPQRPQVAVWMEDEAGAVELASVRFQELRLHPDLWKSEVEGDASVPAEHHTRFFPSAEGGSAAPAATEPRRATAGPPSVAEDQDAIPPGLAAATDAVRIDYRFAAGWRYLLLQAQTGHEPIVDRPATLGVWVKGDGSGNILRCRFVDSSGQTFQPDGPKLNFNDWRYITFPLDGRRSGHWGGDHSGIVRYPVRLQTLLLIDSAARQPTAGGVWVAGASLLED
ncbi:MAG: hypothetical protein NZ561_09560, partial [Phycisphaerae bacterium]|nr:hypothetical protein [Phycisphaerae bacterium]